MLYHDCRCPQRKVRFVTQLTLLVALVAAATGGQTAHAFPPFEKWMSEKAGFQTDCAYCHVNPAGPTGDGVGQEGRLDFRQKERLHSADSPILNTFGQHLLKTLSYEKVVSSVSDPGSLAVQMKGYDLDRDGVSDGEEMEHGTLAYDPLSAPPALVWKERLRQNWSFVATLALSALAGAAGLFFLAMERKDVER